MKEIYIRPDGVISMSSRVRGMSGKAGAIGQNVRRIVSSLDWEVSAKGSIGNAAAEIGRRTERLAEQAVQLGDLVRKGAQEFRNADMSLARNMEDVLDNMGKVSKAVAKLTLGSNVKMSFDGRNTEDFFKRASDWLGRVWDGTKSLAKDIWDGAGDLLGKIKGFFKENSIVNHVLDGLQFALDMVGLVPVFGEIADGVNALIYTLRGDYVNAALSAAAIIPFAGWFATGGKFINKGIKLLDKADDIYRVVKGAAKAAGDLISTVKTLLKTNVDRIFESVKSVFKYGDNIKLTTVEGIEVALSRSELKAELKASGMTEDAAEKAIKCMENGCFPGETLVLVKDGYRRIDQIREGELVLAKDVNTGEMGYKPVKQVYIKSSAEFVCLNIEGEEIRTTASHLFFTDSGWWKAAENIKKGDRIAGSDGIIKEVNSITLEQLAEAERIYNLNVEDYHTYFVGSLGLLVHNNCSEAMTSILKSDAPEYYKDLVKKYGADGKYFDRTLDEFDSLAKDPAKNFQVNDKSIIERQAGLELEARGDLPGPIRRDPNPAGAEFIDALGIKWDIKGWYSRYAPTGYSLQKAMADIVESIDKGENVIIDTTKMYQQHIDEVRKAAETAGLADKIRWWP